MIFGRVLTLLVILAMMPALTLAQGTLKLADVVPFNSSVKKGLLKNGIPYYILENHKPAKRLDLILTVNAGAVLEDDNQDGLAHFCEHMAFNGTQLFPKQELVKFLESTGIRFGADLNAYTTQDETVYLLTVPLDNAQSLIKAVQVLRDWAGWVNYEDEDIESERGVIMEEWRLGKGAEDRVQKKHAEYIYYGSKYAVRDVIGDSAVLLHSSPDNLRRFYKKWYNPKNMSVIAVGDVGAEALEEILYKYFVMPPSAGQANDVLRPQIIIPGHQEMLVSIASDPELQTASADLYIKRPADTVVTYGDYKWQIAGRLVESMLNSRLGELARKAKPPFVNAGFGTYAIARETRAFYGRTIASDKNVLKSLNALMTELQRARKHGFTQTELDRAKESLMSSMERYYNERDKTESQGLAMELSRHVLTVESVPGIVHEYEIYQEITPTITVEDCLKQLAAVSGPENRVITISVPEGNGYIKPTVKQVQDLVAAVLAKNVDAYVDDVPLKPLLENTPTPGTIMKREEIKEVDVRKLTLSNGAVVYLKKTDFKNDEILFAMQAPGGLSLGSEADHISNSNATALVDESGLAEFDATTLTKMLQGKNISISPAMGMESEGFRGSTSPKDMKTMFELLHMYFTSPRLDNDAVESYKSRMTAMVENRSKSPEGALFDSVTTIMSGHHPRVQPTTKERIAQIDPAKAFAFYKQRFANAGKYTYFIVGNFDEAQVEDYLKTYVASLPGKPSTESWKDVGIKTARGKIDRTVYAGKEAKSFVALLISGEAKYTPENRYDLIALSEVLSIRLREQMREEKGGVYFVSVQPQIEKVPRQEYSMVVIFSCSPDRVDELIVVVEKEIEFMKENEVEQSYVDKVKQIQTNEREVSKTQNQYWLRGLSSIVRDGEPFSAFAQRDELISKLTTAQIKKAANTYLSMKNFARFVLKPEQK
ncbi:MAG: insulinase family protein [Ignavibacteria bacterium]|nr:insulinase family protein [Ignavibacteria bacterium]